VAAEKPATAAEYAYFGINVDIIGLSTQDYIMRSPQTLLAPLLALTLVSATFLTLNAAVRTRITRAVACAAEIAVPGVSRGQCISLVIQASRMSGAALLAVGGGRRLCITYPEPFAAPAAEPAAAGRTRKRNGRAGI
jgi:hypothetical protein